MLDTRVGPRRSDTGSGPKRVAALIRVLLVWLLLVGTFCDRVFSEQQATGIVNEHPAKANFLINFTRFVEWPAGGNDGAFNRLSFCLVGATPIDLALERALAGKRIQGRIPSVKRLVNMDDINGCHVVFVSQSAQNATPKLIDKVGDSSVLTVGETPGFAQHGGIIELMVVADELRFAVNLAAARRANLVLSSQLLKLAQIVLDDL